MDAKWGRLVVEWIGSRVRTSEDGSVDAAPGGSRVE